MTKELALYCGKTYKEGANIKISIENLSTYTLVEPIAPTGTVVAGTVAGTATTTTPDAIATYK